MKKQLLETYLYQQRGGQSSVSSVQPPDQGSTVGGGELVPVSSSDNISLEEFREYVKKWFELDNTIKRAQEAIRERRKARDKLSLAISAFMCKYDIEDLNTKEGRIRCKVSTVKAPVNQKVVKQRISDYFKNDDKKKEEILTKIYNEREEKERVSLRRLKIT